MLKLDQKPVSVAGNGRSGLAAEPSERGRVVFNSVVKNYGSVRVVHGIDFDVKAGQLVTLLGPSGCGKTTTLRMIAGLELATGGSISIGGVDVTRLPATYRNVAMVFQSYALFPHMNVLDNVSYGLRMTNVAKQEAAARAENALELVGLAGFGARLPSELSGGQQQRVAVARAVVLNPEVLLLDEPLSNLDAKLRRHVREEIRSLQQRLKLTAVYVTHDQEEAMAVSDRIIVMDKGRISQDGSPEDLYERPQSAFVAGFIGEANLVDCEVIKAGSDATTVDLSGHQLTIPIGGAKAGAGVLVIRPPSMKLDISGKTGVPATVVSASYLGDKMLYCLESPIGKLLHTEAISDNTSVITGTVGVVLDPAKLRVTSAV